MADENTTRAVTTYQTYLMHKASSTATQYTKLIDISSFPDMIGNPERIDITTLSDPQRVYMNGIADRDDMTFNAFYSPENYAAIVSCEGKQLDYAVWFGATTSNGVDTPDGSKGVFTWTGDIHAGISGGGVNEAVGMTITCTPSTAVVYKANPSA